MFWKQYVQTSIIFQSYYSSLEVSSRNDKKPDPVQTDKLFVYQQDITYVIMWQIVDAQFINDYWNLSMSNCNIQQTEAAQNNIVVRQRFVQIILSTKNNYIGFQGNYMFIQQ